MKVTVLIVTHQSQDEISHCINSIYKYIIDVDFEIIMIDNASTDDTTKIVKKQFPEVIIKENKSNEGFAKANNIGAKIAKGRFLFFLNPDSVITDNSIKALLSIYESNQRYGIVAPHIHNADGSFQFSTGENPNVFSTLFEAYGMYLFLPNTLFGYRNRLTTKSNMKVGWVTGACFIIKKEFFDILNGFDENFFLYLEDVDLCYRMKNEIKKHIIYTSKTSIKHFKGKSSKNNSYISKLSSYKSKLYYHKKHNGYLIYLTLFPIIYFSILVKLIFLILLMKNKEQILSQLKVLFKIFTNR